MTANGLKQEPNTVKGSKQRYLSGQNNLQVLGVILFVKLYLAFHLIFHRFFTI